MVGVVIVTHGQFGKELLKTSAMIIGTQEQLKVVSVDNKNCVEESRDEINAAVNEVNSGDGVLILTDMFGGTPSNLSLSFLNRENVEVVTGVNLPMVIKVVTLRTEHSLKKTAEYTKKYGQESILVASDILKKINK